MWLLGGAESMAQMSVGPNVNMSRMPLNQQEVSIVINPNNPDELFSFSNHEVLGPGMFAAYSKDGGQTWYSTAGPGDLIPGDFIFADGNDDLLPACCDPTVAWDEFGNLFLAYIDLVANFTIEIAISLDGGATFEFLDSLGVRGDQPTLAVGPGSAGAPGSLWVTYNDDRAEVPGILAHGAPVFGLNSVGTFQPQDVMAAIGHYGDIAVGPDGQVLAAYQNPDDENGPINLYVHLDPDGLGPEPFGEAIIPTSTNVGGYDAVPAQPDRTIDVELDLVYDHGNCSTRGRVYMVYTDEEPNESDDVDILLRHSDDDGMTWSAPVRVNDDATTNTQFNPRIAFDPETGNIAVSWHDARNDDGGFGPGDHDGVPNNDVQLFASVSQDGGLTFLPNVQVSAGTSDEDGAEPTPAPFISDLDYGDYAGLSFSHGAFYPAWADNSNSTGDNPDGTLSKMDVYTARVEVEGIAHDPDRDGICDVLDNCPTVSNPGQDPDACSQEMGPLSIAFDIPFGRGAATVSWSVTHETDVVGFHVVESRKGERTQLNPEMIPCTSCVTGEEGSYSFTVRRHRGGRHIFVELVREGGIVETHGPAVWELPRLDQVPPRGRRFHR